MCCIILRFEFSDYSKFTGSNKHALTPRPSYSFLRCNHSTPQHSQLDGDGDHSETASNCWYLLRRLKQIQQQKRLSKAKGQSFTIAITATNRFPLQYFLLQQISLLFSPTMKPFLIVEVADFNFNFNFDYYAWARISARMAKSISDSRVAAASASASFYATFSASFD